MRLPKNAKERDLLLKELRQAVTFQIELWEVLLSISETLDCDHDIISNYVMHAAVTADDGTDMNQADLDELLGIAQKRIVIEKQLRESERPIN